MTCPNGHDNPAGQHFCGECGAPLAANRSEAELLALAEAEAEAEAAEAEARAAAARARVIKARNATASGSQSGQPAQKSDPSPLQSGQLASKQTAPKPSQGMPPPAPNWSRSAAKKRKVWPWVLLGVFVLFFGACTLFALAGSTGKDIPAMDKDGTYYHIGDSAVGTYETQGSARTNGRPCNWVRLSADWNKKDTIEDLHAAFIDNGDVQPGETARVTVKSGEYFVSYGCKPWRYVS